ncbi:hypothetical protein J3E72DRAFT_380800 [Bipolaris maydis]|nr:hypothetical protein J3E72DRAFT_380800 [Bipolaris maydis]
MKDTTASDCFSIPTEVSPIPNQSRQLSSPIHPNHLQTTILSHQNQQHQSSSGGRPTGATGGGYYRHPCRNWQQEGHPKNYNFIDQNDQLCAHCLCAPANVEPRFTQYHYTKP